jgi:uncharacterized protein YcbX
MQVGVVKELHRYPVKSMQGEQPDSLSLGLAGIHGDRAWAIRDEKDGGIRGAKKFAALMSCTAGYSGEPAETGSSPAEIRLPDGSSFSAGSDEAAEQLSKYLDHPVTVWPLLPADALEHYRRGAPTNEDMEQELRAIFGRTADEPLPDLSVFPPEIVEFESPPGTYFDAFPLLLMTQASLDSMQKRAAASRFEVRRFRPNLVFGETGAGIEFPEREWCGGRLQIGEAVISVEIECPRCVMTTHGFSDLPKDPKVMRALVKEAGGNLGVYAKVERAGEIRVGDPVELL